MRSDPSGFVMKFAADDWKSYRIAGLGLLGRHAFGWTGPSPVLDPSGPALRAAILAIRYLRDSI
jgi:hypothetical protein